MMSDIVRAAGLLVYRRSENINRYLLLQASYQPFHWTPPKGHVDPGEDEWVAALRETKEEAGISSEQLEIDKNFHHVMHYIVNGKDKSVTYWLAHVKGDENVTISHEHQNYQWAPLDEAIKLSKFKEMETMLKEAEEYINKK